MVREEEETEREKRREKKIGVCHDFSKTVGHEIKLRIASRRITGSHMHRSGRLGKRKISSL